MRAEAPRRLLRVTSLNTSPAAYAPILRLQELLFEQRKAGLIPDTLLQLEHSHVFTVGKRGGDADFRTPAGALRSAGAELAAIPRGGETTYHGPGQLVLYPILSLRGLGLGARAYVEGLEDVMVAALGRYGIAARGRVPGKTGVWVGERKVGAIGVRISQGVTCHGIALNVATDLSWYRHIVPCGTPDKEVTSVHRQLAGEARYWQHAQRAQQADRQQQQGDQQQTEQQRPAASLRAAPDSSASQEAASPAAAAPQLTAPPLQQVARDLVDAFAAHFGYGQLEPLPDVNQLASELGCLDAGSG